MAKGPRQDRLGDAPIESSLHGVMNALGRVLDETLNGKKQKGEPKEWGFVLICFPFAEAELARGGGTGRANYISNAKRDDVLTMLKEQVKRFEGQPEVEGRA